LGIVVPELPNLNRFYETYKDKVEVIGVNLQEKETIVKDFIASRGISFPIALDPSGQASYAFGIQYTNTHFLIDRNGNLVRTIPGDIQESDIISLIQ
jgi:peroxiredoxin